MTKISYWKQAVIAAAWLVSACAPKFDWREIRGPDASYTVLMPGKPTTLTRNIALGAGTVVMTMAAAEVDGVNYAVGSAELPDPAQAQAALGAIENALVKNINGAVLSRGVAMIAVGTGATAGHAPAAMIEASGVARTSANEPQSMRLLARFVVRQSRVYQVVVLGRANSILREQADTFLGSFKPN